MADGEKALNRICQNWIVKIRYLAMKDYFLSVLLLLSIEPIWDLSVSKSLEHESNEAEIEFSRGIV